MLRNTSQHLSLGVFCMLEMCCSGAGNLIHFISPPPAPEQFKNFVLMFKENHLVFAQKSTQKCRSPSPSSTSTFFFARDCSTEWKNNECVASPHRPIDVTFSKQFFPFFFFLQDFGLRQCCKSILLSPNVSRWMCVEAVKVNDRSLTHS